MQRISAIEVATRTGKNCNRFAWASVCEEEEEQEEQQMAEQENEKKQNELHKKTATMSRADKFTASEIYQMTT